MKKIEKDTIVWAKFLDFPYWPAIITKVKHDQTYEIYFFGEDLKGIVPLKNIKLWTDELTRKQKASVLEDQSLGFAYGIALKFIQNEFEFKDHVDYLNQVNKKKIINSVKKLLDAQVVRARKDLIKKKKKENNNTDKGHSDEVKIAKEKETKFLSKKRKRLSLNNHRLIRHQRNKSNEIENEPSKKELTISRCKDKETSEKEKEGPNETLVDISEMDYHEVDNFLHTLNPIIKKIEASANIILSKFNKITKVLHNDNNQDEETNLYVLKSMENIQKQLNEIYANQFINIIQINKDLLQANIKSKSKKKKIKHDEDIEMKSIEKEGEIKSLEEGEIVSKEHEEEEKEQHSQSNNEEEDNAFNNTSEVLSIPQFLDRIIQIKKSVSSDLTPSNLLKYKSIYSFFKVISHELNEQSLQNSLSSIKQFHDQIINGSYIFNSINTNDTMKTNHAYRLKIRDKIYGVLKQIFDYLEIPISQTFITNISQFFEMKSAKKDPTITSKYNEFLFNLFQAFKQELVIKPKFITTMLK